MRTARAHNHSQSHTLGHARVCMHRFSSCSFNMCGATYNWQATTKTCPGLSPGEIASQVWNAFSIFVVSLTIMDFLCSISAPKCVLILQFALASSPRVQVGQPPWRCVCYSLVARSLTVATGCGSTSGPPLFGLGHQGAAPLGSLQCQQARQAVPSHCHLPHTRTYNLHAHNIICQHIRKTACFSAISHQRPASC